MSGAVLLIHSAPRAPSVARIETLLVAQRTRTLALELELMLPVVVFPVLAVFGLRVLPRGPEQFRFLATRTVRQSRS